jgi:hypothetical protein
MTIPFVVLAAIVAMGWRLRALESRGQPTYQNTPSEGGRAFVVLMLIVLALCVYNYHGAWTVQH